MSNTNQFFLYAPDNALPPLKSPAYKLLYLLRDGKPHSREEGVDLLGEGMRSPLQDLRGERYGFWMIKNVKLKGEKQTFIQLDHRHLMGDKELDTRARAERRVLYLQASENSVKNAVFRLRRISLELVWARKKLFELYPDASNDLQFNQKKDQPND